MNKEKSKDIALFRYGLIAPVLHEEGKGIMKYFREISKITYRIPNSKKKKSFSISTLKEWLRHYRNGGIDALYPSIRSDKGKSKKIDLDLHKKIQKIIEAHPYLSISGIYRKIVKEGVITREDFSEVTLRNYVFNQKLKDPQTPIIGRKKFESPAINLLWIADFMHCYPIVDSSDHNRKKKTYLCGIIDDHSRLLVGGKFFFKENSHALSETAKAAILQYGLMKKTLLRQWECFFHWLFTTCLRETWDSPYPLQAL